jgi:hypothetical protein
VTLSDLADIAEIAGAIAVVVSLVYLAIQVRQNTDSVRSATLQANTALWSSLLSGLAERGTVEAYAAGLSGSKDISPMQYTQFFLLCRGLFAVIRRTPVATADKYFRQWQSIPRDQESTG